MDRLLLTVLFGIVLISLQHHRWYR